MATNRPPFCGDRLSRYAGPVTTSVGSPQTVPAAKVSLVEHSGIAEADFAAAVASPATALDERFVEAFAVAGTADDCRKGLAAYRTAGVTDLVLTFVGPDPVADMARFSLGATT